VVTATYHLGIHARGLNFLKISAYIRVYINSKEMKLAARVLSSLILVGIATFYFSCKGDDGEKSEQDAQIQKLNGTWEIQSSDDVTLSASAPSEDFTGFTLTISGTVGQNTLSYIKSQGSLPTVSPWESSGTLTFGQNVMETLVRDDDVIITYEVTDSQLIMTFDYDPNAGGRVRNVEGAWKFVFTKQ
jgi:hypothetical protein